MTTIKRGLDLPISGSPEQVIDGAISARSVAVLGRDYIGMKPTMAVKEGDRVKLGQALFTDKKCPAVVYTSPGAGTVLAVNRGHQRVLQSVVIDLDEDAGEITFDSYAATELDNLDRQTIVERLLTSGLWTSLRTRPFSKVADPNQQAHSLFINTMDSNPLAANPAVILQEKFQDFIAGVNLLAKLPEHKTYLCQAHGDPAGLANGNYADSVDIRSFGGMHPAGLTGTHIHFTMPAGPARHVWTINYQDVIAIGQLFTSGRISTERVIAIAGPHLREPRLVRTRLGANLEELLAGQLVAQDTRIISGSVLGGKKAEGAEAFLGRYHLQVTAIKEDLGRPFMGYLSPGMERHSVMGIYLSQLFKGKKFAMTSSTQGSSRAMVPIGAYEKVMPLDVLPTQLLRALIVGDIETAQNLGALELDEEDLALCSYVCPGKYEFGPILRDNLNRIEKES